VKLIKCTPNDVKFHTSVVYIEFLKSELLLFRHRLHRAEKVNLWLLTRTALTYCNAFSGGRTQYSVWEY